LVGARTALVNAARGLTKSYGERLQKCGTHQMNRETAKELSQELRDALDPLLGEIESLTERIAEYDRRIVALTLIGLLMEGVVRIVRQISALDYWLTVSRNSA
jgi:transposase